MNWLRKFFLSYHTAAVSFNAGERNIIRDEVAHTHQAQGGRDYVSVVKITRI